MRGVVCSSAPQHACQPRVRTQAHRRLARQLVIAPAKITNRFDESADQVKKLLDRDRKEVQEFGDIGGAFKAEFDEGQDDAPTTTATAAGQPAKAPSAAKPASPFGAAAPTASPFGAQRKLMEPEGLSPTMPAMPVSKDPWWKKITLTQVVIVLSSTLIIVSMLATFFVVLQSGGVRFNED